LAQDNLFDLTTLPVRCAASRSRPGEQLSLVRSELDRRSGSVTTPEPERLGAEATTGIGSFGKRYLQATQSDWSDPLGYVITAV